jgi:hypothetical protein
MPALEWPPLSSAISGIEGRSLVEILAVFWVVGVEKLPWQPSRILLPMRKDLFVLCATSWEKMALS